MWNPDKRLHRPEQIGWSPDDALLEAVFETLDVGVAALTTRAEGEEAEAVSVLEALGTAVALFRGDEAKEHVPDAVRVRLGELLADLTFAELDEATDELVSSAARCLTLDPEEFGDELLPLLEGLRTRDRIELLWLGAELLGIEGSIATDAQSVRRVFDDVAAPEIWQLIPLGTLRTTELEWMAPAMRERFWWRSRGAALDANALSDVGRFAEIEEIFPEARPHLEAVRRTYPAAGALRKATPARASKRSAFLDRLLREPPARVISLRARVAEWTQARERTDEGQLRAAAASGAHGADALVLAEGEHLDLSLRGDTLILDVLSDLAPGSVPRLKIGAHERLCEAVPKSEQRFTTTLAPEDLDATGFVVVLQLESGDTVEIPFDEFGADFA
jgi:hypothetical protein